MESVTQLFLAALLFLFTSNGFCNQRVHCQWGPYGDWFECDGCTKLQSRSRAMAVYAQFGGNPCDGERSQTRACETTRGCPLEDGCGDRFRCRSGKCISQSLVCNGDQDCEEDGHDERGCDMEKHIVCLKSVPPPNIDLLGLGFDVVSGRRRAPVVDTKSFGGQCRVIYSGVHNALYRLPLSTIQYSFMVKAQNDFSDEMYSSKWHYAKDIVNRQKVTGTTTGYNNYDFHETQDRSQTQKLLVLKNDIEVAQFQSNSPQHLPLSEGFWKALVKLPSVYDFAAYRTVLQRFGTHYLSEGSLGGSFRIVGKIDEATEKQMVSTSYQYDECAKTKRWFLIFPIKHVSCKRGQDEVTFHSGNSRSNNVKKVNVLGGDIQFIAGLTNMQLSDPDRNWEMYSNWAESVRYFPDVVKQTLRPLSELVKEVQCAGVKRLYLRRAIEQHLAESDTCHCRPCSNNGLVVMAADECKCICKPDTSGLACEQGSEVEGQPGVIHGGWACWSSWSGCSGVRRTRRRSCSNPTPQNGGQQCTGEPAEESDCEDQDLQHLKDMEPHCFDQTLSANQMCGNPPGLINGYILVPKDIYLVGSTVEYTCTGSYYLVGDSILECTAHQTWSTSPGLCTVSRCNIQSLSDDITASPSQQTYGIGDTVTLSCPAGRQLLGEPTVICDPSLHFSPDPTDIKCSPVSTPQPRSSPVVQCQPWEKSSRGKCVCKMPFECSSSSLEVCATNPVNRRTVLLNVCKMHALHCMGKTQMIAEDSTCKWPERNTTGCTMCHMWEACDDQTNMCRCKDSADCLTPGLNVCVTVGDDAAAVSQTMSECDAGLRRCKGGKVSVVSILPCAAEDTASTTRL
ncbi:complement component C7 isoform X1 [Pseudoliparis swirei]|uniref:complement component C7 isoform X1 n=1 Tax=Pseudoliparis swirei TaxID=2059687 RepID=UPI0024BD8B5F|nr:complement component C7 isoform X1 [Pseudoliparis swirei]